MRRVILALLVVLVLVGGCYAEAEIRFRDFEWGTSVDVIEKDIKQLGYMVQSAENYMPYWGTCEQQLDFMYDEISKEEIGWMGVAVKLGGGTKVAGYDVETILFYCAYEFDENGDLLKDKQDSSLYQATYEIVPSDTNAAYKDLKDKLSTLYGEYTEYEKEGYSGEAIEKIAEWRGENDTAVRLYGQMKNTEIKTANFWEIIKITYGKADADEHIWAIEDRIMHNNLAAESALYGNNDTSGL